VASERPGERSAIAELIQAVQDVEAEVERHRFDYMPFGTVAAEQKRGVVREAFRRAETELARFSPLPVKVLARRLAEGLASLTRSAEQRMNPSWHEFKKAVAAAAEKKAHGHEPRALDGRIEDTPIPAALLSKVEERFQEATRGMWAWHSDYMSRFNDRWAGNSAHVGIPLRIVDHHWAFALNLGEARLSVLLDVLRTRPGGPGKYRWAIRADLYRVTMPVLSQARRLLRAHEKAEGKRFSQDMKRLKEFEGSILRTLMRDIDPTGITSGSVSLTPPKRQRGSRRPRAASDVLGDGASERASSKLGRDHVFISYSHEDERTLKALQRHLIPFERDGRVQRWDDTRIGVGAGWREEIREAIDRAKVAVLLISDAFLASDFISKNELPPLLAAAAAKGVRIIPVIVRPCSFMAVRELSRFQAFNSPERSLAEMSPQPRARELVRLAELIAASLARPETSFD
jgi:TIR domain